MSRVNLIITSKCNLRCKHCYLGKSLFQEVNVVEILRFLEKFSEVGKEVLFTGGECTLHSDIHEILCYSKEIGLKIKVFSNGMNLNEGIIKYLDGCIVSLDGIKSVHNYLRNNEMSYDNVLKTLHILNNKMISTSLQCTVFEKNIECLDYFNQIIKDYNNIKRIKLKKLLRKGHAVNLDGLIRENENKLIYREVNRLNELNNYRSIYYSDIYTASEAKRILESSNVFFPIWMDFCNNRTYIFENLRDFVVERCDFYSFQYLESRMEHAKKYILELMSEIKRDYYDLEELIEARC